MAAKKKTTTKARKKPPTPTEGASAKATRGRLQRSDAEKLQIVQQVMASGNQSAEIKKLGIYPNQFYDWKKKYLDGGAAPAAAGGRRGRAPSAAGGSMSVAAEARQYIQGKSALLERLKRQREELDQLIGQMED